MTKVLSPTNSRVKFMFFVYRVRDKGIPKEKTYIFPLITCTITFKKHIGQLGILQVTPIHSFKVINIIYCQTHIAN